MLRWLRPPRTLRPTRAGWVFFALTFGVGFGALNTGNNLLYLVLSLMLAFLVLSGLLSESALRGIEVVRRLPRELFAEAPARVHLEIHNTQTRVPAFAVAVEDVWAAEPDPDHPERGARAAGRVFALQVTPEGVERRHYLLRAPQRGPRAFRGFRVSTRFPFGLFLKSRWLDAPDAVLVYPAVALVPVAAARGAREPDESVATPERRGAGDAVSGLREYAAGDALRRVHWRRSLQRGELVVREVEETRAPWREVRLRTRGVSPARFEALVRRAASEVVAHLDAGLRVGLRTEDAVLPAAGGPAQRTRLLAHLARVERVDGTLGARDAAEDAA